MSRVLVAGGTGFVGSHVVAAFVEAGFQVRSLARRPADADAFPGVDYLVGDAANAADIAAAVAGADVAVFAVTTTTPGSAAGDPAFDLATNVGAAVRLLEAAEEARVRDLVVVSSGGTVYGLPERLPIREDHPTDPISVYGVTKLAVEKVLALGTPRTTVLRVGNAFGERQYPGRGQGAAAAFLRALLDGEPVELWGDGSVVRDYVYAGDVGEACVAAATRTDDRTRVFNVGSGRGTSLHELLGACARVAGREPELDVRPGRAFDVPAVVLDPSAAERELGWRATTPLEEGLARAYAWLERASADTRAAFDAGRP